MRRLSGPDAWFLYSERPGWPMHVGALCIVDATEVPDWGFARLRELLVERLPRVPEFAMKVKEVPLGLDLPVLVPDRDFKLDHHLHRLGLPSPGGPRELGELVADLAEVPLDRGRPLWDMWLIEGLEHGRSALFVKTHHALVDGVSGAGLAEILADLEPNPAKGQSPAPLPSTSESVPSDLELLARGAASALVKPIHTARWAADFARRTVANTRTAQRLGGRTVFDQAPIVPFNGVLGPMRRFAFTSMPLASVKQVKDAHQVKVNDVVLALAAGAVRSWLLARDALPDQSVVASVPMSIRAEADLERGNQLVTLYASLATDEDDPVERLHAIAAGMRSAKEIGNAVKAKEIRRLSETIMPGLANLGWRAYQRANAEAMGFQPSNLIVSNVPGAPVPIYVAGAQVVAAHPVPPLVIGQGLNITLMSYQDSIDVGFICDREKIDDPWELVDGMHASLDELLAAEPRS